MGLFAQWSLNRRNACEQILQFSIGPHQRILRRALLLLHSIQARVDPSNLCYHVIVRPSICLNGHASQNKKARSKCRYQNDEFGAVILSGLSNFLAEVNNGWPQQLGGQPRLFYTGMRARRRRSHLLIGGWRPFGAGGAVRFTHRFL